MLDKMSDCSYWQYGRLKCVLTENERVCRGVVLSMHRALLVTITYSSTSSNTIYGFMIGTFDGAGAGA